MTNRPRNKEYMREAQQRSREKRKEQGLKQVIFWIRPEWLEDIKSLIRQKEEGQ